MKKSAKRKPKFKQPPQEINTTGTLNVSFVEKKTPKTPWDPTIQRYIKHIIAELNEDELPFENEDIITEIMVSALKGVQSMLGRGDLKLLSRTLRELRYAFKIFKDYRSVRKITLFGSARTATTHPEYQLAKKFAHQIARDGYMTITGAGPGIMQAGNEGAGARNSFGVNIQLPFEQYPNKYIANKPTYIDCKYFFTRKLVFIKEASAAVIFPGGYGTMDEAFELLTLVQTGKSNPIPIIFMEPPKGRFWKEMDQFIKRKLLSTKKISPEDLHLYKIMHSADQACNEILRFYSNYHSMRYVGNKLVLRLKKPVQNSTLKIIDKKFKDILKSGKFHKSNALPQESNQPEIRHLPRLVFNFNRINNGRLRQLIDYLNKL